MQVLLLITFVASALGVTTTPFTEIPPTEPSTTTTTESSETEQSFCQRGECLSISACINNQGQVQESTMCTCPAVYCCYSTATETTEGEQEGSTSTVFPSEPTTLSTSTEQQSTPSTTQLQEESTSEPTTVSEPSTLSSSTEQQSTSSTTQLPESSEQTTVLPEGSSRAFENSSPQVATEQQFPFSSEGTILGEAECTSWSCVLNEECEGMEGTEGVNKEDCPEPYLKCCLPEY